MGVSKGVSCRSFFDNKALYCYNWLLYGGMSIKTKRCFSLAHRDQFRVFPFSQFWSVIKEVRVIGK